MPVDEATFARQDARSLPYGQSVSARIIGTYVPQITLHAWSNVSRGLRGNSLAGSPYPRLHKKFVLTVVPAQNSTSIFAPSKPLIGPQSSPSRRAALPAK